MKPHPYFDTIRADEVAECWEGVLQCEGLYDALWGIAALMPSLPNKEDSGPHDHIGTFCLSSAWHTLSPEHQAQLNELAIAQEKMIRSWMSGSEPYPA